MSPVARPISRVAAAMSGRKGLIWLKNGHFSILDSLEPSDCPVAATIAAFAINVKEHLVLGPHPWDIRGDSALHGREAAAGLRSHLPGVKDQELSVGEGMIPTESRMLENSTSGLMSGGEETQLGTRLRHRRVAKAAGNSDSLDLRQARLPSTLPRGLHSSQECNLAQAFSPQRVLASEERSGHYGRASMCALRGKGQARARPAQSVPRRLQTKPRKMLKTKDFSTLCSATW